MIWPEVYGSLPWNKLVFWGSELWAVLAVCSLFENMQRAADMKREPQGSTMSMVMLITLTWPSDYTSEKLVSSVWSHPKCRVSLTTQGRELEHTEGMVWMVSLQRWVQTTKQCCQELQESGTTLSPASRKQRPSRCLRVAANPAYLYVLLVLALPAEQAPALESLDVLKSSVFEIQFFQGTSQVISPSLPSLLLAKSELQRAFLL